MPTTGASSHGTGYWFYQGNLPNASGTRTVLHANACCADPQHVRMSFECHTHSMNIVFVQNGGAWDFRELQSYDCDSAWSYAAWFYASAGCQNPPRVGYYAVWTNCHVGNSQ